MTIKEAILTVDSTHLVFTLFDEIVQIVFPEAIAH